MPAKSALEALIPITVSPDDRAFLVAWLSQAGDTATAAGLRGRVQAILGLQALHPAHPPLAELLEDPLARAVLVAKPGNRTGVRRQLRRRRAGT